MLDTYPEFGSFSAVERARGITLAGLALSALFGTGGCGPKRIACTTLVPPPAPLPRSVQVTFLGVGGLIVRWAGSAVMAAPLYSNPTVGELIASEIHADRQRIDALLRQDVSDVRAILSGHAHYDHLMDVPYVALHKATKADVLGNDATKKILAPIETALEPRKVVSLQRPGASAYEVDGTRFRIRAIASEHSPQIGPRLFGWGPRLVGLLVNLSDVTLWRGEPEKEAESLPVRAGGWPSGLALAFVIELLEQDSESVAFRIYYQDSPTRQPYGYPPCSGDCAFDLAVLCMGGATEYRSFPRDIVSYLHPKYVMGIHWEDFFNPRRLPLPGETSARESLYSAPGVQPSKFLAAVHGAQPAGGRAIVPCPDHVTTFVRDGGSWTIAGADAAWSTAKR
jgi:hypothetical protein